MSANRYLFTSESVSMGHPDKVADQISDAILDHCLAADPLSRVACETMVTTDLAIVSGEITLHADGLYVQVSQPATGHDGGILFRTCEGREDYAGGTNNFASLDLLNQPKELASLIREKCGV